MRTILFALALSALSIVSAAENSQRLLQFDKQTVAKQVKTSDDAMVGVALVGQGAKTALQVSCKAGTTGFPGIAVTAPGVAWDLSTVGHVEVRVANTGKSAIDLALRVDNPGDWKLSPWNAEHVGIAPGATGTVRVCFGYNFGQPGYALDAKRISQVLVFVTGKAEEQSFRLETLAVGGKPGEKP
jgi:hypothetical protein